MTTERVRRGRPMTPEAVRRLVTEVLDSRKSEIDELVSRAARRAVTETLTALGVDSGNPIEAQATFAALRELVKTFSSKDFQADLAHLSYWRKSVEGVKSRGMGLIITALITSAIAWLALGFKVSITH